ncbi:MAG TPA: hypothetical protein VFK05_01430 [Polyangiaceae bacterium]|nr:hypothetical protein [Polyangiaceae bacterium]
MTSLASAVDAPPIVRVYVAGSPEAVSRSRDAIQDLCSRSNVAVVVRDAAGADEALLATSHAPGLADAYVDLRADTPPRVVVVDGESRQDLERRTLPEGVSLEISIETMAHVVCAAVESSLAARAAAAPKVVPPKAPAPPAPPEPPKEVAEAPAERARWHTRASLFASGANFGAGIRGGGGAEFGLSYGRARWRFGALLGVLGYPAADIESADGLADFALVGGRAIPLLEWQAARPLTVFAGVGVGVDWIKVSGELPPPGAVSSPTEKVWEPLASGVIGLRLTLGRGLSAFLALDTDVALVHHRYVIETEGGTKPFFEPSRVRPMGLAGFSLALDGGGEASGARREAHR